jgi:hypothetical protein
MYKKDSTSGIIHCADSANIRVKLALHNFQYAGSDVIQCRIILSDRSAVGATALVSNPSTPPSMSVHLATRSFRYMHMHAKLPLCSVFHEIPYCTHSLHSPTEDIGVRQY